MEARAHLQSFSPVTGEVVGEVPFAHKDDVARAVATARAAQRAWGQRSADARGAELQRFRHAVLERSRELEDIVVRESGKPRQEAFVLDIAALALHTKYFADKAAEILAPRRVSHPLLKHKRSIVHYIPRGVVGVIAPWNFPLYLPMSSVVSAAAAGNGVVLKPSEHTPLIAAKAKDIWDDCGLPKDLFQVVQGRGDVGAELVRHVDFVSFIGSVRTGRAIGIACAERLIACSLELGGKAPAIVRRDADLERTANALVWGAFANGGQICASVERVLAHRDVAAELTERVVAGVRKLRLGDPATSLEVEVAHLVMPRHVDHIEAQVRDAVEHGATVATGGKRYGHQSFEPTVLTGCTPAMRVMHEETFGPLLPIMSVDSDEQALAIANDSHLGLAAYVFGEDREGAERLACQIEAGSVLVNDTVLGAGMPPAPWHGVKQSGLGRVNSEDALRDLCQERHVCSEALRLGRRELWWFPYSREDLDAAHKVAMAALGEGGMRRARAVVDALAALRKRSS